MRSKVEPIVHHKKGDRREIKKFAFLRHRCEGDIIVWLEFYSEVQEFREHGIYRGVFYWMPVYNRHICRPEGPSVRGGYSPYHPCICGEEALAVRPNKPHRGGHRAGLPWER